MKTHGIFAAAIAGAIAGSGMVALAQISGGGGRTTQLANKIKAVSGTSVCLADSSNNDIVCFDRTATTGTMTWGSGIDGGFYACPSGGTGCAQTVRVQDSTDTTRTVLTLNGITQSSQLADAQGSPNTVTVTGANGNSITVGGSQVSINTTGTKGVNIGNGSGTITLGGGSAFVTWKKYTNTVDVASLAANTGSDTALGVATTTDTDDDCTVSRQPNGSNGTFANPNVQAGSINITTENVRTVAQDPASFTYNFWCIED